MDRESPESGRWAAAASRLPSCSKTSRSSERQRRRAGYGILGLGFGFRCLDRSCKGDEPLNPAARNGNLRDYNTRGSHNFLPVTGFVTTPTEFSESGASNPRQPEAEGW